MKKTIYKLLCVACMMGSALGLASCSTDSLEIEQQGVQHLDAYTSAAAVR